MGQPISNAGWSSRVATDVAARITLPAIAIAAALLAWELAIDAFAVPLYLLPKPSQFLASLWIDRAALSEEAWATSRVIFIGFGLSVLIAVPLAFLITSFRVLEEGLYPLIVFFKIIPKTITGPLLLLWLGLGDAPKITLTVMITFFPILIDAMTGFRQLPTNVLYLSRSMGASWLQTFFFIRVPSAMPFIFSGMKIGIVSAVTATIIAEFIGSSEGLGFLILQASSSMNTPLLFSGIVTVGLVGLLFSMAVLSMERLLLPWLAVRQER